MQFVSCCPPVVPVRYWSDSPAVEVLFSVSEGDVVVPQSEFDAVLLGGPDEELNAYIEQSNRCLVVDWRGDEGSIVDEIARMLPSGQLSHEWVDADRDMYITFRGRRHKAGHVWSGCDRYITLRKLNEVLAREYELRVFWHTYGDDTHCFYVAPCSWWAAMGGAHSAEVARVFGRITPGMDFPDYRGEPDKHADIPRPDPNAGPGR